MIALERPFDATRSCPLFAQSARKNYHVIGQRCTVHHSHNRWPQTRNKRENFHGSIHELNRGNEFDAATIWLSIFALVTSPRRPAARTETTKFHANLHGCETSVASE
jgi:hypothetical protein